MLFFMALHLNANMDLSRTQQSAQMSQIKHRLTIISKQDPVRKVLDHVDGSKRAFESQRERWVKMHSAYHGAKGRGTGVKGRSNLYFRKIFSQIEMETARFITAYFSSRPYATVLATKAGSVDGARLMEDTLQFYHEHCPVFYLTKQKQVKYTLIYGTSYTVPSWKKIVRPTKRIVPVQLYGTDIGFEEIIEDTTVYEGLWYETYSPSEAYPYPWGRPGTLLPQIVLEEYIHITELVQAAKDGAYDLGKVMKVPLNAAGQSESDRQRKMAAIGRNEPEHDPDMIRLLHWFAEDHWLTLANDEILIRDEPNPFEHGEIPVIQSIKTLDPDSFSPISTTELMLPYEKAYNALKNSAIDQVISSLWPLWKYKAGAINPNHLLSLPNHRIPVRNMDDVEVIKLPEMKSDILAILASLEFDMEDVVGFFATQKGQRTPGSGQTTATSDTIFNEQGNVRIGFNVQNMEKFTWKPEARQSASIIIQMMPKGTSMRIHGPGGAHFLDVTPEQLRGEYDYQVTNGSEGINRSVIQQQLINFFALANESTQFVRLEDGQIAPVPLVDTYNYIRNIIQGWDKNLTDRVLYRPELFGTPISNDLLGQFNIPPIPGLDQLPVQGGTGARGVVPQNGNGTRRSVNPNSQQTQQTSINRLSQRIT